MSKSILKKRPSSIPDDYPAPLEEILPKIDLIDDDGEPMESDWHVKAMLLLISCTEWWFRDRDDFYVGGNMFIYFSEQQARNRDFRGPDYFFVKNTRRKPLRKYWVTWLENGRTPNVVIELCSRSTLKQDYGKKKLIYQDILHVSDYFCYNPDRKKLEGWRLKNGEYEPLKPNARGWLWSEELQLWVGVWKGKVGRFDDTWLRFFDRDGNLVLSEDEGALQLTEAEKRNAEVEKNRALAEKNRADAAEAEVADLREQLAALRKKPHAANGNGHGKRKKK